MANTSGETPADPADAVSGSSEATSSVWNDLADPIILFEAALNAVILMDLDGIIRAWNPAAQRTFGWSAHEAVGHPLVELIVPDQYRARHRAGLERYRETGEGPVLGQVLEVSALRRDGEEFPVELAISNAWPDVNGSPVFMAYIRDMSRQRSVESALQDAFEQATRAQRETDAAVSMIVHELRTPLTVVAGYSDLLAQELSHPTDAQRRYLDSVRAKAEELQRITDSLLLASRLAAGGVQPTAVTADLSAELRAAADRAQAAASLVGATLETAHDAQHVPVSLDPHYTGVIFDNLISNAIRYGGDSPRVTLSVVAREGEATAFVEDDGPGIPSDQRVKVFDRFVRLAEHTPSTGTGLGLYTARQLAECQGATLEIEDSPRGCRFAVRFPMAFPAGDPASVPGHS